MPAPAWTYYGDAKLPVYGEWIVMFNDHNNRRFMLEYEFRSLAEAQSFAMTAKIPSTGGSYSVSHFDRETSSYVRIEE